MKRFIHLAALCLISICGAALAEPATQPVQIEPKAAAQLKLMSQAYTKLKSLSLTGTIDLAADIQGQKLNDHSDFAASFTAPLKFRHEIKNDTIITGTGEKIYIYLPKYNRYLSADAPKESGERAKGDDLPPDLHNLLGIQDISLALAISDDPNNELIADATAVTAAPDVAIDGKAYPAILIASAAEDQTVAFDPATHLVRRVIEDKSRGLRARGADVKLATVTVDYPQTTPDAAINADQFTFVPPPTAQELKPEGAAATALIGHPAPDFTMSLLDGKTVNNASLKGSVYVLDFWATWCGPCRMSLPGLDETYKRRKADGVKIFAVNKQESAEDIKKFITDTGLSVPVLLDSDGKVGDAYGADAIPQTVVVGRDGLVRNVFIGTGPGREAEIDAAIGTALHGQ